MSISINVRGMNFKGLSCAEQTAIDKKRKNRLAQVRQQSKEIAQQVRFKVQCEKENQLKRFQEIKQRELNEWKKRRQCDIQEEYGACLTNFGAAHIAACEASCEEDEALFQRRGENDLLAAQRGRAAMLQEQRKRDREAEERLLKKKRKRQKNASVQANLVTRSQANRSPIRISVPPVVDESPDESNEEICEEDESNSARAETFSSKPNLHKSSASNYNPKNFTSNSVDSSNNYESEDEVSSAELESEQEEFNQITNLLKQKCYENYQHPAKVVKEPVVLSDSSIEVEPPPPPKAKKPSLNMQSTKKSILKTSQMKPKSLTKQSLGQDQRVKYVDCGNKYTTTYLPDEDLVIHNTKTSTSNAKTEATKLNQRTIVNNDILRQLAEIRSQEALEKEKTRRDYERLRMELDEVAKHEKEAKEKAGKDFNNFSTRQFNKQEQNRTKLMNQAVENALRRNIITCPPVEEEQTIKNTNEVNVAPSGIQIASSTVSDHTATANRGEKDEISNLVKVERLKDLLERINHQKKLLLREIEKSDDIPGPDLEKVMQCLDKLEKEKAALDMKQEKKQEMEELVAREQKLEEREKRFEHRIKEMFKAQKELITAKNGSDSSGSSEEATVVPPLEITIKVLPKSPRAAKVRKTIRCLDTLSREPGKAYPRTPKKKTKPVPEKNKAEGSVEFHEKPEPKTVQQETQTSPPLCDAPKPILKKPQEHRQVQTSFKTDRSKQSEDSSQSISTAYQSLPDRIAPPLDQYLLRKPHHNLNPVLMHYITRLLGMSKNIGNQLSVNTSPVETPGSSTINTSGNCSSIIQIPSFDQKRLERLQEFINDNYSFLSEINETLERSQLPEQSEHSFDEVDGIWRDVLRKKKPQSVPDNRSKTTEHLRQKQQISSAVSSRVSRKSQPQQKVLQPKSSAPKQEAASQKSTQPSHQSSKQQSSKKTFVLSNPERPRTAIPPRPQLPSRPPTSQRPQITQRDMLNVTKHLESHMMNNFAEYTANCQKRIGDLAQMMERVRQEKLKLIENSLSSGEFGHFTEYKEIVVSGKMQDAPTTSASDLKESPSQREDPPSEEINNILQKQTRPFGVSKDSGISMLSRPVTSSDFRDSPDVRVTSEERENTFQPIFRDIPKPSKLKLTQTNDGGATQTVADVSLLIKEHEEKAQKKQKPPLSLKCFSPHLEKPHEPHELSTIAEVETPSASKVNILDRVEECDVGEIESFPCFEEYAKNLQSNVHHNESLSTSSLHFPNLGDLKKALEEMKIKSFLGPAEYGIQELSSDNTSGSSSSASSLPDIYEELKRRKIIDKPFQDVIEDEDMCSPHLSPHLEQAKSPKRKSPQSQIIIETSDKVEIKVHREKPKTPTKKNFSAEAPRPESPRSNDTLSGIQEIEKESKDDLGIDLNRMGLKWAASMFKRDIESKKIESSSSSTSIERGQSIEIDIQTSHNRNQSSSSSSNGRPLNLREFLVRELTKRSHGEKSFSDESSLSSQFMRSLLNASSSGSKSGNSSERKLLTSTPVPKMGNSTARSGNENLFVGDSMSTVKGSESEASGKSDKSKNDNQQ